MTMKELNLMRLMDSCCVSIDKEYYDKLFEYLIDIDVDLNELNIDDLVVNHIDCITYTEMEDNNKSIDDYNVIAKKDDGAYVFI